MAYVQGLKLDTQSYMDNILFIVIEIYKSSLFLTRQSIVFLIGPKAMVLGDLQDYATKGMHLM